MLKENEFITRNGPLTVVVDKSTGEYIRKAGPDDLPKVEELDFKIEIAVCEFIDGSYASKKERGTFHVEVRFIPSPGAHSICFQGVRHHERTKAEAEKTYVESVFKRAILKEPKPLKERTRTKRVKRSRRA